MVQKGTVWQALSVTDDACLHPETHRNTTLTCHDALLVCKSICTACSGWKIVYFTLLILPHYPVKVRRVIERTPIAVTQTTSAINGASSSPAVSWNSGSHWSHNNRGLLTGDNSHCSVFTGSFYSTSLHHTHIDTAVSDTGTWHWDLTAGRKGETDSKIRLIKLSYLVKLPWKKGRYVRECSQVIEHRQKWKCEGQPSKIHCMNTHCPACTLYSAWFGGVCNESECGVFMEQWFSASSWAARRNTYASQYSGGIHD